MKKRIISLILAAVMCFSMVACGENKNGGSSNADNSASKEGVFDVVDLEGITDAMGSDDYNISKLKAVGDTLYMTADVYTNNGYQVRYLTADMDGNIKTSTTIYEQVWETYDETDDGIAYEAVAVDMAVAQPVEEVAEEEEGWHNIYSYSILSDGKLVYVDCYEKNNAETGMYETTNYVVVCDETGTEISRTNISEGLGQDESVWVNLIVESEAGTVYVLCYEKNFEVAIEGGVIGTYEGNEVTQDLYNVAFYKDGYPVFSTWNDDYTEQKYAKIDIRKGEVLEEIPVMERLSNYTIFEGTNSGYDLVLSNSYAVYGYNIGDTEPTEIMNYINSNLATYRVRYICFKDSEHFVAMYNDIVEYDNHVASFTKVAPENVPDRQVLTMAVYGSDTDVTKAVIDYNRNSDQYKILVKDYSQYATNDDWYAGIDQLKMDITSGNIPDILKCSDRLSIADYASKGLFVDFYELMEKDETINREDYAENVFKAYETDGKLYQLPTMFYIWTVFGKTSIWGEESGITWDEVAAVQAQYPEAQLFSEMTRSVALSESLRYSYGQLVDEETGECHFDSELFKSILEYANTYPAEIDYDKLYSDDNYWLNYETQYMEDRTLLTSTTIYSIYDAWAGTVRNFGEAATPVGFPTDEGQGSVVSAISSYAISAKSDYVDGAWDFVKSFITEDKQMVAEDGDRYTIWSIPVLKKGIEQQAQFITQKPYYFDGDGNKVEYDDYIWLGDEEIVIEPATQEEAQKWVDYVLSVDRKASNDYDKALEIISEEAEAYFSGQKKVEDVMSIIQSRMDIFISESR